MVKFLDQYHFDRVVYGDVVKFMISNFIICSSMKASFLCICSLNSYLHCIGPSVSYYLWKMIEEHRYDPMIG